MASLSRLHRTIVLSWIACLIVAFLLNYVEAARVTARWKSESRRWMGWTRNRDEQQHLRLAEGLKGAVAADEGRCSAIGKDVMKNDGGNAVDAAVATTLCLGVVNPGSSGIGGGGFLVLFLAKTGHAIAYDLREVAPAASSEDMYSSDSNLKDYGPLSIGVPGEVAGLHLVWAEYGSLPWESLFQPALKLAEEGFIVKPYLAGLINSSAKYILTDEGLRNIFAPNGTILQAGDICYNTALAKTLRAIAAGGPDVFYKGVVGENLVKDVQAIGGILTMEDLNAYMVKVREPLVQHMQDLTLIGMPPPSSGAATMFMVLNILAAYPDPFEAVSMSLGLHHIVEAFKHAFAVRMHLGDPDFVDVTAPLADMLNATFAAELQQLISDSTTYPPPFYGGRWSELTSQLEDHGTSHFNVVDEDRNVVAMTTTVNFSFGAKILSPSTGIVLNNEMGDFSIFVNDSQDPPLKTNFIAPFKRPLSSMSPLIVLKDGQFLGALGGSGGVKIITTVIQVFLNHFWKGYNPLDSVTYPRIHHQLMPDIVKYEDWTTIVGDHIEEPEVFVKSLQEKGHNVTTMTGGMLQLIVQNVTEQTIHMVMEQGHAKKKYFLGKLIAVSDLRKDGFPAAY